MTIPPDHKALLEATDYPLGVQTMSVFSDEELALLRRYGWWLSSLAAGHIQPHTDSDRRFVDVCHGKAKAETLAERAWIKLMMRREYESESHQVIDAFDPAERWFPRQASWIYNRGRYP
jgi:uncharacterized protein YifE (UPF0438 family)